MSKVEDMRKLAAVCVLLSACCADTPGTLGDAVDEMAPVTCSRWVRCGFITRTQESCEDEIRSYFCKSLDCDGGYEPTDRFSECMAELEAAACTDVLEPCLSIPEGF